MTFLFFANFKFFGKSTTVFLFVSVVIAENLSKYRIYGNFEIAGMR